MGVTMLLVAITTFMQKFDIINYHILLIYLKINAKTLFLFTQQDRKFAKLAVTLYNVNLDSSLLLISRKNSLLVRTNLTNNIHTKKSLTSTSFTQKLY